LKAVILAGGLGTRISEETQMRPKPMVEIGGRPILWHIMKTYSAWGVNDFIVCLGYRGYVIKEYFANYFLHMSDVTFDMNDNSTTVHNQNAEPWKVTLVDTGDSTMTGGRLRRVIPHLEGESDFCFTYGDGVTDADLSAEIAFHRAHGLSVTLLAVRPPGRFGALKVEDGLVSSFEEKPAGNGDYINGGFFVVSKKALHLLASDDTSWESDALPALAADGELVPFCHNGFWQPMDTLREKNDLEALWQSGQAPWKKWS
jgi:glucose-1-phosphate cytidylyltransferase